MIAWRFYAKGTKSNFDSYRATYGKYHKIVVTKVKETRYTIQWYHGDRVDYKEVFEAKDWNEAKAYAISLVRDYIMQQVEYWTRLRTGVNNWIDY